MTAKPMLETIVDLLTPHFEVVGTAADGNTALEIINRLKPDVAVLDVSMPFKTGIEVAAELKTSAPEVKVVIIPPMTMKLTFAPLAGPCLSVRHQDSFDR
jgi:DNA-binding NarL/FixJ family response regulator